MINQIAKAIYHKELAIMKKILDLMAFKFDQRTNEYKYMKKQVMDYTYEGLKKLFSQLETDKLIKKCSCGTNVRKGYKPCTCGGSGYINT